MGALRREVLSPLQHWRKPHTLAALFFSTLLFATSLDALLLSYRLRAAEIEADLQMRPIHIRVVTAEEIAAADRLVEQAIASQQALAAERGAAPSVEPPPAPAAQPALPPPALRAAFDDDPLSCLP